MQMVELYPLQVSPSAQRLKQRGGRGAGAMDKNPSATVHDRHDISRCYGTRFPTRMHEETGTKMTPTRYGTKPQLGAVSAKNCAFLALREYLAVSTHRSPSETAFGPLLSFK